MRNTTIRKTKTATTVKRIIKAAIMAFLAILLFFVFYSLTVISQAPKIDPNNIYKTLSESTVLYDNNGHVMDTVYQKDGNRINVRYDDIPKNLRNAVIATEDKTFWTHHGFNFRRMFGAVLESLTGGGDISGTSTITQQLARNVYLPDIKSERTISRKLEEAWYTVLLEKNLSKEQILEAYMNTIYLGYNSYGVESASMAYFSKSCKDLNLTECAALAAIPSSPSAYALVQLYDNNTATQKSIRLKKLDVIKETDAYTIVYNGKASKNRRRLILNNMAEQGYISEKQLETAKHRSLRRELDLSGRNRSASGSYMSDYVMKEVVSDLIDAGYSESEAKKMLYTGGLRIHTTMDSDVQETLNRNFSASYNFPQLQNLHYNSADNITDKSGNILLYRYSNLIDANKNLVLRGSEWREDENGNLILKSGKHLTFHENGKEVSVNVKKMYTYEDGVLETINGTTLLIPGDMETLVSGDLQVSSEYLQKNPSLFRTEGSTLYISPEAYVLGQKSQQPQGAMVILDYKTGEIKGMVGGRNTESKMLYNRADATHQPGSSIKPLSVYSTALQQGADAGKAKQPMDFPQLDENERPKSYGKYWTAASRINDAPLTFEGRVWPKNWYSGYRGMMTLRKSVEQSVNVNAVRVFQQLGDQAAVDQLEKFGITSLTLTGEHNDRNPAALALGGMTKGISPVEMASAYGTFPNKGVHITPYSYTTVKDIDGNVILDNTKNIQKQRVIDTGTAYIMTDILRTTVSNGTAKNAQLSVLTAGKTGTTDDKFDAWFCGFTPQYAAACWLGSDENLELAEGSEAAAQLWHDVMNELTIGRGGSFPPQPSTVLRRNGELFIKGTAPAIIIKKEVTTTTTTTTTTEETEKDKNKKNKNSSKKKRKTH